MAAWLATGRAGSALCKLQQFLIIPWHVWQWFILGAVQLSSTSTAAPGEIGVFSWLSIPSSRFCGLFPRICSSCLWLRGITSQSCQTESSQNIKHAEKHFYVQDKACLWEAAKCPLWTASCGWEEQIQTFLCRDKHTSGASLSVFTGRCQH